MRLKLSPSVPLLLALVVWGCAGQQAPPASPTAPSAPGRDVASGNKAPQTLYIGSGGVTGVYYPAGGAICRLYNRDQPPGGMRCAVESTGGSVENIEGIRAGEWDMGVVQSDVQYDALEGAGPFAAAGPYPELRSLFSLHAEPLAIVARADSGITTVDDLRGKRVNLGNPGSGSRATIEAVMARAGWTMDDFAEVADLPSAAQSRALAAGQVDAILFTVGHPSAAIQEATTDSATRLVPVEGPNVDALVAELPYYAKATIPGGFYRGVADDVPTFGARATLVTSAVMPDDEAYGIVKAVFENFDDFRDLHPALSRLNREEMVRATLSAPLHPGAERYYREAGLL